MWRFPFIAVHNDMYSVHDDIYKQICVLLKAYGSNYSREHIACVKTMHIYGKRGHIMGIKRTEFVLL